MRTAVLSMLAVLLLVACPVNSRSAEQKRGTNAVPRATEKEEKPRGMPFYGKVGAVDTQARTISLVSTEKVRLYHLTPSTRIHRDNVPAKLEDITIGQWIGGFVRPDENGRPAVVTLNLAVVQRNSPASTNGVPRKTTQQPRQGRN
jgi:hypothetical protein